MKKKKIGDIVAIAKGRKAQKVFEDKLQNAVRYIQIEDLRTDNKIQYTADTNGIFVSGSDLCIAWDGANAGTVGYGLSGMIGSTIARLCINDSEIYTPYIGHFLQSKFNILNGRTTGTTIPHVERRRLEELEFLYRPLSEQRRIADILDKADAIRHKRQQSLKLIDDLVKSQFIEMFGDPVTNPMGWDSGALGCKIQTIMAGESVNGEARLLEKGEKAVLKISAVTYGYFDPSEYKVIQNQKGIKKYVYPQKGDLLFSRANTRELVGATAIVPRDFPDLLLPDKLWRLTFHNGLNTYFVKHVLSTDAVRMAMSKQATGTSGSMFNISMEKLKKLTVPVPPLPLQKQFAAFVEQADKSKFTMQRQLSEIEILSSSLKQKFFA